MAVAVTVENLLPVFREYLEDKSKASVELFHLLMLPASADRGLAYDERCRRGSSKICALVPRRMGKTSALATFAAAVLIGTTNWVRVVVNSLRCGHEFLKLVKHVVPPGIKLTSSPRRIGYGSPIQRSIQFITRSELHAKEEQRGGASCVPNDMIVLIDDCMQTCSERLLNWIMHSNRYDPPSVVAIGTPYLGNCAFRDLLTQDPVAWTLSTLGRHSEHDLSDDDGDVTENVVVDLGTQSTLL